MSGLGTAFAVRAGRIQFVNFFIGFTHPLDVYKRQSLYTSTKTEAAWAMEKAPPEISRNNVFFMVFDYYDTVSYTHLDVYKRQGTGSGNLDGFHGGSP